MSRAAAVPSPPLLARWPTLRTALDVQQPWATMLLGGRKSVETRGYPLMSELVGKELAILEPTSRTFIGTVVFGSPFRYETKAAWAADTALRVPVNHIK